jgi:branched-chain amino acid transport system permease protein/neutral amino acid transport system permease protein
VQTLILSLGFGLVTGSILAIASVGFTLQFGVTNVLNLAYGEVMISAAYIGYLATLAGIDPWLGLVLGGLTGSLVSLLLNRGVYAPFIRHGSNIIAILIVSLGMSIIMQNTLQIVFGARFYSFRVPSGPTFHILGMIFTGSQLIIMGIAGVSLLTVHLVLSHTRLGKAMRATAADPALARSCGIRTARVVDVAWLISGGLCGVAGVTLVVNLGSFQSTTGGQSLVPVIASTILGGVGNPYGAMLGALTIGIASELGAALIDPAYKSAIAFAILIIALLVRPQGLFSQVAIEKEAVA